MRNIDSLSKEEKHLDTNRRIIRVIGGFSLIAYEPQTTLKFL